MEVQLPRAGGRLHLRRGRLLSWVVGILGLLLAPTAWAHPIVSPQQSSAGATVRYVLSVPSEKPMATVRIEVQFPRQVRIGQVEPLAGWTVTPERDGTGRILGAIWDGGRVEAGEFVDLAVLADNPPTSVDVAWAAIQTYEDGSEVQWTGSPQSQFPATVTRVVDRSDDGQSSVLIAGASFVVAAVALALATLNLAQSRARRRSG